MRFSFKSINVRHHLIVQVFRSKIKANHEKIEHAVMICDARFVFFTSCSLIISMSILMHLHLHTHRKSETTPARKVRK